MSYPDPLRAERTEEREVLAHLRGVHVRELGELLRRDGRGSRPDELVQDPLVHAASRVTRRLGNPALRARGVPWTRIVPTASV